MQTDIATTSREIYMRTFAQASEMDTEQIAEQIEFLYSIGELLSVATGDDLDVDAIAAVAQLNAYQDTLAVRNGTWDE